MLHTQTGIDVFVARANLDALGIDAHGGGLGWVIPVLVRGIEELYFGQWVPVHVSAVSDAALTLAAAPLALLLMALMASRRARALLACLPLALSATRFCFLGTPGRPFELAVILASGLALLALGIGTAEPGGHDARADRPALARIIARALVRRVPALIACAVISWCACALAPRATAASQAIPIDFGLQSSVLSASSVSPVMDLRRDLVHAQTTTALTYRTDSNGPLYLKLAVLDDLSDDTWLLSTSHADAGSWSLDTLFGGTSAADPALPGDNPQPTPLEAAMADGSRYGVGAAQHVEATINVDGLTSRFAPVPIGAVSTRTDDAEPEGDWSWNGTGTVSGTDSSTYRGQLYTVTAAYVEPIGSIDALDEALDIDARTLAQHVDDGGDADRTARERCLALPGDLPAAVQDVVDRAHEAGVGKACETLADERAALAFLLAYFEDDRFVYDLEAPDGDGRDNMQVVGDFLESGRGYCLHFASAAAVLGRSLGVPSRLVLGYRAGDGQAQDDSYLATNRDLHVWTEVYLFDVGWLPIDVTPGRAPGSGQASASDEEPDETTDRPRQTADDERQTEHEQPDREDEEGAGDPASQTNVASDTPSSGWLAAAARFATERVLPVVAPIGAVALLVASPFAIRRARHAARMRAIARAETHPRRAAEAAWTEVRIRARRLGATWGPSATEEDIARAAAACAPTCAAEIEYVMRAVCLARYGGDGTRPCTADELTAALDPARWPRRA